ncbi:MAG: hypothetical protein JKY61_05900 [Planctomycetes bacterium]|nr:hypothetical protein [Planctomycetota bacterium]
MQGQARIGNAQAPDHIQDPGLSRRVGERRTCQRLAMCHVKHEDSSLGDSISVSRRRLEVLVAWVTSDENAPFKVRIDLDSELRVDRS